MLALGAVLAAVKLSSTHGGPGGALSHVWHQLSGGGAVGSAITSTRSRRTSAAAGGARPGTASLAHPLHGNGADTFETIDRLARPDFQQAGQEHSLLFHVLSGLGLLGAIPAVDRPRRRRRLRGGRHAPARQRALGRRSRWWPASGRSRCTTRSTGSGSRRALTLLAYPIPVLVACAAGGVVARPPRRSVAVVAAAVFALAIVPADAARAQQPRARPRRPPRGAGPRRRGARRGRPRRARSTAPRSTSSSSAPACCRSSSGRGTRAAPSTTRSSLAPKDAQTWLTLAGYQRWCWNEPAWKTSLARARALSGHDNVFAGSDEDVIAASDACTP